MATVTWKHALQQARRSGVGPYLPRLGTYALPLVLAAALWATWQLTARPVHVTVDGIQEQVWTHRRTVAALLLDLGLTLQPQDRVSPPPDTPLQRDMTITVQRARPVRLLVDGRDVQMASWGETPAQILADAGEHVDRYDRILLNGVPVAHDAPLPEPVVTRMAATYDRGHAWNQARLEPIQLRVIRSVPIVVDDGSLPFTVRTTAQTVGEALREAQITIYLGDRVDPSLGSPVTSGLRVRIQRSTPLYIDVDGRLIKTRTRGETVADALTAMGIGVAGLDQVEPGLDTPLYDEIRVKVTRIQEDIHVTEEIAPYETVYVPDPNLPIDTQQVINAGANGITRSRYRVRYENGQEVDRDLLDTWVAQEPQQRVIAYGQKIEPKVFTAADGTQYTYWRKIRMAASSYSASTAGVSPDASYYGRTFTGEPMRFGVVAVDPRIIPLRSQIYVPGYGVGQALDTGSAIRARRIDLGYDDDNLVLWNKWVDVYLLWPPPPDYQITWVLPNWPRPPQ